MHAKASKYLAVESVASGIVNGILNYGSAYLLFHGRALVPTTGPASLLRDLIGETFLVTSLSALCASLIARSRRRSGKLPVYQDLHPTPVGNVYLKALVLGLIFTIVCMAANMIVLPKVFPAGVPFHQVVWFKTLYGAVLGLIATLLAIHKALSVVD